MMTAEITGVPPCRVELAPTLLDGPPGVSGGDGRQGSGSAGGDRRIPALAGGDDGVQLPQDCRGDHGLGLGGGEPVLLAAGQVGEPGGVNRVGELRPQTARQAASRRPGGPGQ